MNLNLWKGLSEQERNSLLSDYEKFDAYSDDSYNLVKELGLELAEKEGAILDKVSVLNRWGSLMILLCFQDNEITKINKFNDSFKYFSFMVSACNKSSWETS